MIPNEKELIEDFIMLIRSPLPHMKMVLFHKIEQLKHEFKEELQEYRDIVSMVENPGIKKGEEYQRRVPFELKKTKSGWSVSIPDTDEGDTDFLIPTELLHRIIAKNIEPGLIYMEKIDLNGRLLYLSVEKQSEHHYTGTIAENNNDNQCEISASGQWEKVKTNNEGALHNRYKEDMETVDLKTLLYYLMNHESFYNHMIKEFAVKWKPILDNRLIMKTT